MSRSYKKNLVVAYTTAVSEKEDKQRAHQALRNHFRQARARAGEDIIFDERNRAHSNIFGHAKDGKQRLDMRVQHLGRALRVLVQPYFAKDVRQVHQLVGK